MGNLDVRGKFKQFGEGFPVFGAQNLNSNNEVKKY